MVYKEGFHSKIKSDLKKQEKQNDNYKKSNIYSKRG